MKMTSYVVLAALVSAAALTASAQTNLPTLTLDNETRSLLRDATADHWLKRDALFSTLLGGLLAAAGGFGAIWMADVLQARRKREDDEEFAANALRAIHRELQALSEVYDNGIGRRLKETKAGEPFRFSLAVTQDWFTVFTANASHLGRFDSELSRRVVTVYVRMKQLIEEYRINNQIIETTDRLEHERNFLPPETLAHKSTMMKLQFCQQWMIFEAGRIKEIDQLLKAETNELFAMFAERGIK